MTTITHHFRHPRLRDAVLLVAVTLIVIEVVFGHAYLARSIGALGRARLGWIALAILASVASMAYFARTQRRMLRASGTDVPIHKMLRLAFEANAINVTLPGGTAFSLAYATARLRSFGATTAATGFTLLASGVLSTSTFWALALTYVGLAGGGGAWIAPLVLAVVLVTASVLARRRPGLLSRGAGALVRRAAGVFDGRWQRAARGLRSFADELTVVRPRGKDWAVGTVFAALNWLADLACLAACCLAIAGSGITPLVLLAAYLAGMTASSLSILPGGFGVIEVAMIFALTAGGVPAAAATPAVLLYRLISCILVVAIGWTAWLVASAAGARRAAREQRLVS